MRQFILPMMKETQRPTVVLDDFYHLEAMLDTGSLFPVWVEDEEILEDLGGVVVSDNVEFGGFGGKARGKLYRLPMMKVGSLIFPEFHIIACRMELPCQMILSATMFRHLIYEIDDWNHKFIVSIPNAESEVRNLKIWDKEGRLHVACMSAE